MMHYLKFIAGLAGVLAVVAFCFVVVVALQLYLRMHGLVQPWVTFLGLDPHMVLSAIICAIFLVVVSNYRNFLSWLVFKG